MKEKYSTGNFIKIFSLMLLFLNVSFYAFAESKWSDVKPDKYSLNMDAGYDIVTILIIIILLAILGFIIFRKGKKKKTDSIVLNAKVQSQNTEESTSQSVRKDNEFKDSPSNQKIRELCKEKLEEVYDILTSSNISLNEFGYIDISDNTDNLDIFNASIDVLERLMNEITKGSNEFQIAKDGLEAAKEDPSLAGINAIIGTIKGIEESFD